MNDAGSPIPIASPTAEPAVPQQPELLRTFLAGRDVRCPMCRYNLRDLVGNRCPECGRSIVLSVKAVEFNLGTFTAGVVILAAGAGFFTVALLYGLRRWLYYVEVRPDDLWVAAIVLVINITAIVVWISAWRLLSIGPPWRRRVALCSCVLVTGASFYGFFTYLWDQW